MVGRSLQDSFLLIKPNISMWVIYVKAFLKALQLGWEGSKWSPDLSSCIREERHISASGGLQLPLLSWAQETGRIKVGSHHHFNMMN